MRELGVSDRDRKQIRKLMREYEERNAYNRIEALNRGLVGNRVRPQTLNYETVMNLLEYNIYDNANEIIDRYKQELDYLDKGTTSKFQNYLDNLIDILDDIGISNTQVIRDMSKEELDNIEYLLERYNAYKDTGNVGGMEWARNHIDQITLQASIMG